MRAIAKTKPQPGAEFIDAPVPAPKTGEVLVRIQRTSLCGTDLHILHWDSWAASRIKPPLILGHEFSGVIEAVGPAVKERKVGDFVAGESHIVCGRCRLCRASFGHVCLNTKILGVDTNGVWANFAVVPEANARLTDQRISPEVATLQDPLGNAVHAVSQLGDISNQTILITGCGPIGLMAIGVAKALGAKRIIATEVHAPRLQLAEAMGAEVLINPAKQNAVTAIQAATKGSGVEAAVEMSGHPSSLKLITEIIQPAGRISLLGIYPGSVEIDLNQLIFKGVSIQAIVGRRLYQTWETMQELLISGRLDIRPIITHQLPATEFDRAIDLIDKGEAAKVVFAW